MSKRVWIIGGSSGIGLELVKLYLQKSDDVIVSARTASASCVLQELLLLYPNNLKIVDIDVTNTKNVIDKTAHALEHFNGIDICLYNAGVYECMKIDSWNLEHFEMMNQVNYMGALRVITALTPYFKKQNGGAFIFNISISSYLGLPYGGGYSAPKAALLNFCESIQPELIQHNITVQVINHGFVKTRLTHKNTFEMPQLLEPSEAADKIYNELNKPYKFEIRFPFLLTRFLNILRMLPYSISLRLTKKAL